MDPPLLQQLQLSSEYSISPDHQCVDPVTSHDHHSPFNSGRETLGTPNILALSHGNSAKCLTSRQATESSYSGTSQSISDSGSSAGSAANGNSIAFTFPPPSSLSTQSGSSSNLQAPFLASSPLFGTSYGFSPNAFSSLAALPHTRSQFSTPGDASNSSLLHSIRTSNIPTATSHGTGSVRESYTASIPGIHRHLSSRTQMDLNRTFPDPRSMLSQTSSMNYTSPPTFSSSTPFQQSRNNPSDSPPFEMQQTFVDLKQEDGSPVSVTVDCKIEKGFFLSGDNCWTCYRRNYFSVCCSYALQPLPCGRNVFLERHGKASKFEQIQAMAVCLSAVVDGTTGKTVDLVQHTPKRDRGPQTTVQKTKIMPKPPMDGKMPHHPSQELSSYPNYPFPIPNHHPQIAFPNFPFQQSPDLSIENSDDGIGSSFPGNSTSPNAYQHTFERIQFKSATANNGKRRAQQQYYHLIVELWADVRNSISASSEWVKVAQRMSSQVVVRGRSPSHYSNEGPNSLGRGGGSGNLGGSGSSTPATPHWPTTLMPGGTSSYHSSMSRYSGTSPSSFSYNLNPHQHSHQDGQSTVGSSMMSLADSSHIESLRSVTSNVSTGYHYFPGPLYEAGLASPSAKAMVKQESKSTEDHHGAGSTVVPISSNNCRFIGLESSRGTYHYGNVNHEPGY